MPAIHDITTDTMQPPPFLAVLPLRAGALNPAEYGGPDVAAKQRSGLSRSRAGGPERPARARLRSRAGRGAGDGMGARRVGSGGGRIEATDTTFWFGFKDDVVVRVAPQPSGSRVDVRSLSRVGVGDIGANAARIRRYLAAVKAAS